MAFDNEGVEIAGAAAEPSLRESLASAFAESGVDTGAALATPVQAAALAPQATAEPTAGERARAADGKFAPKTDQPSAAAPEAQAEPIRAPASWSALAKSKFDQLDPSVKAEIVKREKDMDKGLQERAQEISRYKPIDEVLAPHRERIALAGQTEATYVRALVTADEMLRGPNKVQAIQRLAQIYNIPLGQPAPQGQHVQQQPQVHPAIGQLQQQIQTLTQEAQQRQQQEAAAHQQQVQTAIQAFAADPKNAYFENVRDDMGVLLQTGRATTLDEAYDMACNMRPDIRGLIANQPKPQQGDVARQRTQQARQASGSVVGAPGPGSSAPLAAGPANSIRDELRAAMRAQAG